jgi:hypothetical protein
MNLHEWKKANYTYGTRICLIKTGGTLDGQTGTVIGKSFENVIDSYIVSLDNYPTPDVEWSAITITEACLQRIEE